MCSTCGCKGAEGFEAPMTRYDEYCISCGSDCGANSNLCMKCQKMFGVKKASNRMIARLGLGAESFEAETLEDLTKDQLIDLIRGLEDREVYVKDFIDNIDKSAESFEADVYVIESGSKTEMSFQELFDYLNSAIDDEYFLTKKERDDYFDKFYSYDAESFEAQRKLTDIDRDGKPYTGQIYPDHPDLDPTKADRNKDGYMSSWERALGNQVARGMEKYKSERKKPMKRMKMRTSSKKSTSVLPSVIVVGLIAAVVGSKIRK